MNVDEKKLKKIMDEASKGATSLIANPTTIQKLIDAGVPIKEVFIPYEKYIKDLFRKRRKTALDLVSKLPHIDKSIADGVISGLYEEIRSSYAFGIFTSTIFNSIALLEYSLRAFLYEELIKKDLQTKWDPLEELTLGQLIVSVEKLKLLSTDQIEALRDFNKKIRNPYLHINVKKLTKGIYYKGKKINVNKEKITEGRDLKVSDHRFLWFSAKQFYDKYNVQDIINFCVQLTNELRSKKRA